jgi:hypothetical protein
MLYFILVLDLLFPLHGLDVANVRAQLDVFDIEDIDDLMVLNGTDTDVKVSVEEEAAFYTALAAVSAQFTDVFKERVRGAICWQRANHVITVEVTSSLVMFQTAVQSYMSLYQNAISPEALFRSQL